MILSLGRGLSPVSRAMPDSSLKALLPSCVFDLDATRAASYPGTGQVWKNLVPVPADGSSKTTYDFYLGVTSGVSTDDPGFTGTPGTASAYFLVDGGDYFNLPTNSAFINGLQRTDRPSQAYSGFIAFRYVSNGAAQALIATSATTTIVGARLFIQSTGLLTLSQRGDTANINSTHATLIDGTDYLLGFATQSDGTNVRFWVNARSKTDVSRTPNACVSDAPNTLDIGAGGTGSARLASGTRIYATSFFNAYLNDADVAKIFDAYNARHGRTYA